MKKNLNYYGLFKPNSNWHKIILTMKISAFLLFCCLVNIFAAPTYSQSTKISLNLKDVTIEEVLNKIEDESEFYFLYNNKLIDVTRKVNIEADNEPIKNILSDILSNDVKTIIYDKQIILTPNNIETTQQVKISGTVTDSKNGEPLPGVNIVVQGTTIGIMTDVNGKYSIIVPNENAILVFSFLGYVSQSITVGNQTTIKVALTAEVRALDEVVVTAFGIQRQSKSLTYSTQNVTSNTLSEARNLNIVTGLSGRVAGLSITTASTGVGAEAKVLLRGNRSINGSSQPLYVVDGITLNGGISNLSPDDIESISILKSANAAALYGSRANNGAIIITTKSGQGKSEGVTSSLGFTYMGSAPIMLLRTQDIYGQGSTGIYAKNATVSWGPKMDGSQVAHWSNDPNYETYDKTYAYSPQPNNIKDFFRIGNSFITNLQVNVKTKNSNSAVSYTNTIASGIVETNNLTSHNLNIRLTQNFTKKITFDSKLNYVKQNFENVLYTGEGFENPMRYLYEVPRNIRSQDMQHYTFVNLAGQTRQHYWKPNDNGSGNPYWTLYNVKHPVTVDRIISMISLKYQITKNMSILGRSALDETFNKSETKYHNDTYMIAPTGKYVKSNSSSYEWNSDALLNYHQTFSDITIDLNAGTNNRLYEYQSVSGSGSVFNIENLFALSNCSTSLLPDEGYSKKIVRSAYGFGEISYKNAIFMNITGRNDWSSTLPAANRSYFYPSVGLTAILSDLITLPAIFTHLKLRGSFAEVGNDTDPYLLNRTASISLGTITLSSTMPNSNLKPERTKSIETGFDLRMLKDRIRMNFTYYKTNTYDQLFKTSVPVTSGVQYKFQNGADIQNKGVEITLGASVISTKDFEWNIDLNWSKNKSMVMDLTEGLDVLTLSTDYIRCYKLVKGQSFGDVYVRGWHRDDNGNVIILANGLPDLTSGLTVKVANFNPDWLGGISNSFSYKGFSFSALIDIRQGGTFVSQTEAIAAGGGIIDYTEQGRDGTLLFGKNIFKNETGVTTTGDPNTVTCTAENFWNNVGGRINPSGEAFVRSASNIRVREIIFGYNLPKNLVSKTYFTSARVSIVGRNLFFITNKAKYVDPELMNDTQNISEGREAFALPTTRTFGVSLNLGF
jgi:TonB-linked SusC/RagA family outer membrane protein